MPQNALKSNHPYLEAVDKRRIRPEYQDIETASSSGQTLKHSNINLVNYNKPVTSKIIQQVRLRDEEEKTKSL